MTDLGNRLGMGQAVINFLAMQVVHVARDDAGIAFRDKVVLPMMQHTLEKTATTVMQVRFQRGSQYLDQTTPIPTLGNNHAAAGGGEGTGRDGGKQSQSKRRAEGCKEGQAEEGESRQEAAMLEDMCGHIHQVEEGNRHCLL